MPVVAFSENGYRCNGGTFFTNLILKKFGPEIQKIRSNQKAMAFVKKLTMPSISYAKTICHLVGWKRNGGILQQPLADIRGIAHITGGGMQKFVEILPKGIGAYLDSMPLPPDVLLQAQNLSCGTEFELSDLQAYTTLHGGCGMVLVCADLKSAHMVIKEAEKDGIKSSIIGMTTGETDSVKIFSRFQENGIVTLAKK
jgi:phosphoribosylaminoimidazole (AIR) synthetase